MRDQLSAYLSSAIYIIILGITFLTPLFFTTLTTEYFETPKIVLLLITTLVLLTLWAVKWILQGKVTITKTPLDIPLLLLLGIVLLSTWANEPRFTSYFGNFPRIHGSATTWVAYILFYFIAASNLKGFTQVKVTLFALLAASTLAAIISLLSYFGLYLPGLAFAKSPNFTPTGSSFSTTAILALQLPILLYSLIHYKKDHPDNWFLPREVLLVLTSIFGLTIVLVGDLSTQLVTLLSLGLLILVSKRADLKTSSQFLLIPIVISLAVLVISYIPLGNLKNPLMEKRLNFPREIQLDAKTSWKVSGGAFTDAPFLGTGPSTYLFNFTQYKPGEFNVSRFWNLRFDTAYNEYLQVLATLGGLGLLALLFLSAIILSFAWRGFTHLDHNLSPALSISAILIVVTMLFHVTTPVFLITALLLLALLMAVHRQISGKVEELNLGIKASRIGDANTIVADFLPYILLIPIILLVGFGFYHIPKAVYADFNHRKALNAASKPGLETYNRLRDAVIGNNYIDTYRTDLAQTNFALANAIAASKIKQEEGTTSANLTEEDKKNIQNLLGSSIEEARAAITISPRNPQNWEILASIYRQISGVAQNALQFSLDAYGRAIDRDPRNPLLRLNVGGVYYSIKNYDLAIRFFSDAVNLKPDYANAYYNLSVALRDKGDLAGAQTMAEQVVSLLQKDTNNPDFKVASEYLADLKARIATGSANQQQTVPPAAQSNGALQNQDLPNVELDQLKDEPTIATPAAVKKNPQSNLPNASASPAASASSQP